MLFAKRRDYLRLIRLSVKLHSTKGASVSTDRSMPKHGSVSPTAALRALHGVVSNTTQRRSDVSHPKTRFDRLRMEGNGHPSKGQTEILPQTGCTS